VQEGFTEIIGSGGVITNGHAVGGVLTLALSSGLDDRDRGALTGGPGLAQSNLLRDFIFRNTGTGLGITLSTLKAGEYTFTGFFHDSTAKQGDGTLGVDTGDGRGELLKVPGFSYSTGTAPAVIGEASFSFIADGSHPVTVYLRDTNAVPDQPFCINGFVLDKVVRPTVRETLVAHYDFEGSFADVSGNGRHGLPSGAGVTFVADTPPALRNSAKAADFNGTDYVTLPYLGLYRSLAATNGLTLSLWLKSTSTAPQFWFIGEGYTGNDNPAYLFGHTTAAGPERLAALVRTLSGGQPLSTQTATAALYDGGWHHWAWTDLNGTASVYIDGNRVAAAAGTWNYTHSDIPFDTTTLGAWIRDAAETRKYPLVGQMDDVSIWNSVLSESAIKYLAAGGSPLSVGLLGTLIRVD